MLIDIIGYFVFLLVVGGGLSFMFQPVDDFFTNLENNPAEDRIVSLIMFGIYMTIVEVLTRGRSLGKLITGTAAVTSSGETPNVRQLIIRGISRGVPFEAFSGFGNPCNPLHDRWSKTQVIDMKQSKR